MKKFILSFIFAFTAIFSINAQSFQIHQSYNDNKSAWGSTRLISDYFWVSDNGKWNVFSWNSFSQNGISGLLYGERQINETNFFVHAEVRAQFGNFEYSTITPEIGFAYLIPWEGGASIYVTPKYVYNDVYFNKHDFQLSINSSYENDYVYYEGYFDTNWVKAMSFFTEQKGYYKITENFQIGVCVVADGYRAKISDFLGADIISTRAHIQPYLSLRVSLY